MIRYNASAGFIEKTFPFAHTCMIINMKCFQQRLIPNKPNNKYKKKNQVNQQINHILVFFIEIEYCKSLCFNFHNAMCT